MKQEKKEVLINIRGVYRVEEQEDDIIELFTTGTYHREGDTYYISYEESPATGYEGAETTLRVDGGKRVTLCRSGAVDTCLVVQNGVRHQGLYDVGFGNMMIGVRGITIRSTLTDTGGSLRFKYSLDVNSIVASENEMIVDITEQEPVLA